MVYEWGEEQRGPDKRANQIYGMHVGADATLRTLQMHKARPYVEEKQTDRSLSPLSPFSPPCAPSFLTPAHIPSLQPSPAHHPIDCEVRSRQAGFSCSMSGPLIGSRRGKR